MSKLVIVTKHRRQHFYFVGASLSLDDVRKVAFRRCFGRCEQNYNELVHSTSVVEADEISQDMADAMMGLRN